MALFDDIQTLLDIARDASDAMRGDYDFALQWSAGSVKPEVEAYLDSDTWDADSRRFIKAVEAHIEAASDERVRLFDGVIKAEFVAGTVTLRRKNSGMRQSWDHGGWMGEKVTA